MLLQQLHFSKNVNCIEVKLMHQVVFVHA